MNLSKLAAGNDFFGQLHELSVSSGSLVTGSVLLKKGSDFAEGLLKHRKDIVIKEINRYSGASIASSSFVAGVVSFASLDSIGRQMAAGSMDAKGLFRKPGSRSGAIPTIPATLQSTSGYLRKGPIISMQN